VIQKTDQMHQATSGLDVDESIGFRMVRIVNLMTSAFPPESRANGEISIMEWRVLAVVACHPHITMTEIAHFTGYNQMNISRSLRSLQEKKILKRSEDPHDRRRNVTELTKSGSDVYRSISNSAAEIERRLFSGVSDADLEAMSRGINQMLANLYRGFEA